jgi:hypothetical protein
MSPPGNPNNATAGAPESTCPLHWVRPALSVCPAARRARHHPEHKPVGFHLCRARSGDLPFDQAGKRSSPRVPASHIPCGAMAGSSGSTDFWFGVYDLKQALSCLQVSLQVLRGNGNGCTVSKQSARARQPLPDIPHPYLPTADHGNRQRQCHPHRQVRQQDQCR